MKNLKLTPFFAMLFAVALVVSCVKDDDFEVPDTSVTEVNIDGTIIDIDDLYDSWQQNVTANEENALTFEETDQYISGYVISSDESGNFFEEVVLQNNIENPTRGVKVLLDVNPLFNKYEIGRKVFIKLEGLTVGFGNGVFTLGLRGTSDDRFEKIPSAQEEEYFVRSPEVATIVPAVKTLSQLTDADVNTLIQLSSAQFTESQIDLSFANEESDEFDGDRTVESCDADGGSILFQTSTFSDFKALNLPDGAGTLTAVLSKDFFGENFALNVRDTNDINFDGERCEPTLLDPNVTATTTFAAVVNRFIQDGGYSEFGLDEEELIIEGYVISSDQSGNFFEELVVQNATDGNDLGPNNPRLGLRVYLDRGDLFQTLPVGRKIYIKLNGLAIDEFRGNLTLGIAGGSSIQQIPDGVIDQFIIPGEVVADITPLMSTVNGLSGNDLNTLVQVEDMQFAASQLGLTFAGEATDQFDGIRQLESCDDSGDINLYTSTFATFKSVTVPENTGTITAIFTNNFNGDERIFELRDLNDIEFNNPERCDPPIVDCGTAASEGGTVLFAENFETQTVGAPVSGNGMVNFQEAGTQPWSTFSSTSTNASIGITANIGSFNSGDDSTISWLAFPEINFDAQDGETLRFVTSNSFSDGSTLEVLFSSDWDGVAANIPNATWAILPAATIVDDEAFFGDYFDSGIVDLSCVEGTGYVAFKYVGSGEQEFDGTYELDELEIRSN